MAVLEHLKSAKSSLVAARRELMTQLNKEKGRRRGALVRQLHEVDRMLDSRYAFASQAGQDRVVDKLMNHKRGGVFVDVGGYDGLTGSNSLFFEQYRGWTGVLAEPMPDQFEQAQARRRCVCEPVAVSDKDGTAEFIAVTKGYTQMSGLTDHYDKTLLVKVRANPAHKEETISVQTKSLATLLSDANLTEVDFLSLDIEGGELAALEAFPFKDFQVRTWAIENNTGSNAVHKLMSSNGFTLVEFCGPDEIYSLAD